MSFPSLLDTLKSQRKRRNIMNREKSALVSLAASRGFLVSRKRGGKIQSMYLVAGLLGFVVIAFLAWAFKAR